MALYFLQQRSAPIIPSLQDVRLDKVLRKHDGHDVSFATDVPAAQALVAKDAQVRVKTLAAAAHAAEDEAQRRETERASVDTTKKGQKSKNKNKSKDTKDKGPAEARLGSIGGVADDATVADLLFEFFRFYAYEFSIKDDMVCPRLGYAKVPRSPQHQKPKWR
jgi:hypothetical protein